MFELFFQSEGAPGFDVNVTAVQATGAPDHLDRRLSGRLGTAGAGPLVTLWVGSETDGLRAVPEPGSLTLLGGGLAGLAAVGFRRRERNLRQP